MVDAGRTVAETGGAADATALTNPTSAAMTVVAVLLIRTTPLRFLRHDHSAA